MNPPAIYLKQFQIKEAIELSLVTSWFDLELSTYYINVKVAMSKKRPWDHSTDFLCDTESSPDLVYYLRFALSKC